MSKISNNYAAAPLMHKSTCQALERFLNNPANAIGLYGDRWAGKAGVAKHLTKKLLNADSVINQPGYFEVDSRPGGIDAIRAMQAYLSLKVPGEQKIKRVVYIADIDQMGHEAQNALLKTLEEAPADTVIITSLSRSSAVLTTIHSRLAKIDVLPVSLEECIEWFTGKYDQKEIKRYFYMSGGQAGLIQALLEQKAEHALVKAIALARSLLAESRYQRLARVDHLIKSKDVDLVDLLEGFQRLLDAHFKLSLINGGKTATASSLKKVEAVQQAINDLTSKVSTKLVLSRLFSEL